MTRPLKRNTREVRAEAHYKRTHALERRQYPYAQYEIKIFSDEDLVEAGDGKFIFAIPIDISTLALRVAEAFVSTVSSSGLPTVQIRNITQAQDMLTTKITIDAGDFTSYAAAVSSEINPLTSVVALADRIAVDVDVAGSGAKGLGVILGFGPPPVIAIAAASASALSGPNVQLAGPSSSSSARRSASSELFPPAV